MNEQQSALERIQDDLILRFKSRNVIIDLFLLKMILIGVRCVKLGSCF
jgi:hypothetical protein